MSVSKGQKVKHTQYSDKGQGVVLDTSNSLATVQWSDGTTTIVNKNKLK